MPDFDTIGKYEVLELIGEGGFGVVYKARDPLMERLVAIKVCSTEDEQIRKRFLREAKIAGGLDHANIVIAFDFGTEEDVPYLVQELLTGEDLRTIIDRQDTIEPTVKLHYLVQIAKGLQHAHAQGVWHRDIKPANVRILDDNRAKLMDFGMAKITTESGTRLTADGSVMGTAGYFAPEQLKALELDQRVDIFSYGVLAYELLTYRKVFPGETFMVVFRQVLHDEPEPLITVWPDCPEALAELVEKCLCKEPDDRFASFDDILPILYSILGSASFDRRSEHRGTDEPTQPAATVLQPVGDLASPTIVAPRPSAPGHEEAQVSEPEPTATEPLAAPNAREPESAAPARATMPPPTPNRSGSAARRQVAFGTKTWLISGSAIVLLGALGIWLLAGSDEEPAPPANVVESAAGSVSDSPVADPAIPAFAVLVEASPWGEVSQIVDQAGERVTLPQSRSTPMSVRLPAGSFVITVADPRSSEIGTCEISVSEESAPPCEIAFPPLDPLEYFKEAGWWK